MIEKKRHDQLLPGDVVIGYIDEFLLILNVEDNSKLSHGKISQYVTLTFLDSSGQARKQSVTSDMLISVIKNE